MQAKEPIPAIPAERRTLIIDLLERTGSVKIRELQTMFGVSHMTVHRDLDQLAEEGQLRKVRGGAVIARPIERATTGETRCDLCGMRVPPRTEVILTKKDKSQLHACCAHCGLLLLNDEAGVESALGRDFLYNRITNLFQAHFLIDSSVRPCCMPSTLCFATAAEAQGFQNGFGGVVLSYQAALEHLAGTHGRDATHIR